MGTGTREEPSFYFISDSLQYTIRGEVVLEEPVDGALLQEAVDIAFQRFPYFSVQMVLQNGRYVLIPNHRPHNVLHSDETLTLGSEAVNDHLVVVSWFENKIFFHVLHSLTDGAGRAPLTKAVLYYYLTRKYGIELDPEGIYLADSEMFGDEDQDDVPVSLERMERAGDQCFRRSEHAGNLLERGIVADGPRTEWRFSTDEASFIAACKSLGATPNSLASVLLAQSVWELDPDFAENVVVNLCVNLRKALQCPHNHRLLLACVPVSFGPESKEASAEELCKRARGSISSQSCEGNLFYLYRKNRLQADKLRKIRKLELKQKIMQSCIYGEEGFLGATFLVSYVGRGSLGSLAPYVKAMYTTVDSIPRGGAMLEMTTASGRFFFSCIQDFQDDRLVRTLIRRLEALGLSIEVQGSGPVRAPHMQLPGTSLRLVRGTTSRIRS